MYDLLHRLTLATLWLVGLATLTALGRVDGAAALPLLHREVMLASVAAALLVAPWVAALRWPAVCAAVVSKASMIALAFATGASGAVAGLGSDALQLVALLAAGAFLAIERRREARWNGVLPLRQEG